MTVAVHSALAAFRGHVRDAEGVARRVAVDPLGDPARDGVDLVLARIGVRAAAAVVRSADELQGELLDVLA